MNSSNTYSRTSMARTGLRPWKFVLAKGNSNHPGWIKHKMNLRDHNDSSSQPRWTSYQSLSNWSSNALVYQFLILTRGHIWNDILTGFVCHSTILTQFVICCPDSKATLGRLSFKFWLITAHEIHRCPTHIKYKYKQQHTHMNRGDYCGQKWLMR